MLFRSYSAAARPSGVNVGQRFVQTLIGDDWQHGVFKHLAQYINLLVIESDRGIGRGQQGLAEKSAQPVLTAPIAVYRGVPIVDQRLLIPPQPAAQHLAN